MKKSYYFLILFIFPLLISCQNNEEIAEIENSQNELIDLLKEKLGDIEGNNIYLLPASLDNEELLYRLIMWTDYGTDVNNKILILGDLKSEGLVEISEMMNYQYGRVFQLDNEIDLIKSAEKIQIRDGAIASRQSLEGFEIE